MTYDQERRIQAYLERHAGALRECRADPMPNASLEGLAKFMGRLKAMPGPKKDLTGVAQCAILFP